MFKYIEIWIGDTKYGVSKVVLGVAKLSEIRVYSQRKRALPQVNPPPKTGMQTKSPGLTLLSLMASSSAIAHEAEEILPYLWTVI